MAAVPIHKEDEAGLLMYRKADLVATAALVQGSATRLFGVQADNSANGAKTYLHFYDAAAAADVTVGTTVPVKSIMLPATTGVFNFYWQKPPAFALGLVIAATTTLTGSTAPTAILVTIDYR